jgi:hypothetical protein
MKILAAGLLLLATGGQEPASTEAASTWEYRLLKKEQVADLGNKDLARGLNSLGGEGWELVAVDAVYIFKRPKNSNRRRTEDLKDEARILESDVEQWKDRVAWSQRMRKKGFVSENQFQAEREWLRRAEIALERARRDLKALDPSVKEPAEKMRQPER